VCWYVSNQKNSEHERLLNEILFNKILFLLMFIYYVKILSELDYLLVIGVWNFSGSHAGASKPFALRILIRVTTRDYPQQINWLRCGQSFMVALNANGSDAGAWELE